MPTPDPPNLSFAFGSLIEEALEGFITRPSIESEIRVALSKPPRLCVVVGEPGSGKTSLAASLIRSGGFLHHFLRKGHVEFGLWRDPYAFLTSVGFQLLRRFGDALFPREVLLDLRGRISNVERGATAVLAEVSELVTVPWHSGNWKVSLEASRIDGEAVGLRISKVIADYRHIPLTTFRRMALLDPLLRLLQLNPSQQVVLWVDGLDEEQRSRSGPEAEASTTIGDLLPTADELDELHNLSIVISARPGQHLDRFINGRVTTIELEDERFAGDNASVVKSYISRALEEPAVRKGLERAETPTGTLPEDVAVRAQSNFLYLRHFFEAIRQGDAAVVLSGGLPASLDDIYVRLLGRITDVSPDYLALDHLVVGSLTVANAAISAAQIARFSGLDVNVVNGVIQRLKSFLDVTYRGALPRYAVYHTSFAQTLTADRHQDKIWFVDVAAAHERIAAAYVKAIEAGWHGVDEYGFDFASDHLTNATGPTCRRFLDLLGASWRLAKRKHYGSNQAFEADIGRGSHVAMGLPLPDGLIELGRLAAMRALIHETEGQVPAGALEVIAAAGQVQRALGYVRAGIDPLQAVERVSRILRGLARRRADASGLDLRVFREGLRWAELGKHQINAELFQWGLLEACPATTDPAMPDLIRTAQRILVARNKSFWTGLAAVEIGRLTAPFNELEATRLFEQVADGLPGVSDVTRPETTGRLLEYWAALAPDAALARISGRDVPMTYEVARGFLAIAKALEARNNLNMAASIRQVVMPQFVAAAATPYQLSRLLTEIARSQMERGDLAQASITIEEAVSAAEKILEDTDAGEEVRATDRRLYPVALAYAADVQVLANRDKATGILGQTWASLKKWGYQEERHSEVNVQTLVRAQHCADPDLLQAHIGSLDNQLLKTQILVAAALEVVEHDHRQALDLVDEVLLLTERPLGASFPNEWYFRTASGLREGFYVALGGAFGAEGQADAEALLSTAKVGPSGWVRWRLEALAHLASSNGERAGEWLRETVRLWGNVQDDRQLLFEMPARIASLPTSLSQDLLRAINILDSPAHRVLMAAAYAAQSGDADEVQRLASSWASAASDGRHNFLPGYQLLAFGAGQLCGFQSSTAQRLWTQALLRFRIGTFSLSSERTRRSVPGHDPQSDPQGFFGGAGGFTRAFLDLLIRRQSSADDAEHRPSGLHRSGHVRTCLHAGPRSGRGTKQRGPRDRRPPYECHAARRPQPRLLHGGATPPRCERGSKTFLVHGGDRCGPRGADSRAALSAPGERGYVSLPARS